MHQEHKDTIGLTQN